MKIPNPFSQKQIISKKLISKIVLILTIAFRVKKKTMDINFGMISEQIRANKERFKGLGQDEALKLEKRQKEQFISTQYESMRDHAEVQVTRLKDRITKLEEDLIKQ